ncbi:unnamed protein product [Phytophthora lilii]|uniref:Sugar transporter SWEET1 n=1 Tax=Phytophthora lilii TaxID=2077276 RepID=A0A9W6TL72_9STRA|nr:unnamed protein product [Phytophthora lilii]
MFGSPLATVKKVVQIKSAASLPFIMCFINTVNCLLWVLLALLDPDKFVLIPNAAGAALAIIQLVPWFVYRPNKKTRMIQVIDVTIEDFEIQSTENRRLKSVASPVQELRPCHELSPSFIELRSPPKFANSNVP